MFSSRVQNLNPYVPGEQPNDKDYIKLNANENPYAPPTKILVAISDFIQNQAIALGKYPDPDSEQLRIAIATMLSESNGLLFNAPNQKITINPDMIFCGNGSDEVLSFIFYAFFNQNIPIITPELSYSFYPVYAQYHGLKLKKIALKNNYELDIPAMIKASTQDTAPLIFANPNPPFGTLADIRLILETVPRNIIVVIDEAYADFSGKTALGLLKDYDNLVIVRTFSKSMSFAGMRLGYCVANPSLIKGLITVKNSVNHFPVNVLTQKGGIAACNFWKEYSPLVQNICETRDLFSKKLLADQWKVLSSFANFAMVKNIKLSGFSVYEALKQQGFLVRYFENPQTKDFVRISIGTREQMIKLAECMNTLGG